MSGGRFCNDLRNAGSLQLPQSVDYFTLAMAQYKWFALIAVHMVHARIVNTGYTCSYCISQETKM